MKYTHPGRVRGKLWFGPEVEGALAVARPLTAFVAGKLTVKQQEFLSARRVSHLFITEEFNAWSHLPALLATVAQDVPVTVATRPGKLAKVLRLPYAWRVRVVVRACEAAPWTQLLRAQDAVSVGVPYDLFTFDVARGVRSTPDQYTQDST
jgi:hypothetical protein